MDFITIDFETANAERSSPCEIGLTFVQDYKITETKSWLIKPKQYPRFDSFNVHLHGIRPEDVANCNEFNLLWDKELKHLIEGKFLIAHNAGFDMSVLRNTLQVYQIPFPKIQYTCSYIFSKRVWEKMLSYDLKSLCNHNGIELKHHRAGEDSRACAELCIKAFDLFNVKTYEDFPEKLRTTIGQIFDGGYNPCETKRISKPKDLSNIIGDITKHRPESIFYGHKIVFTGTLSSMVRSEAQQIVADIGGINSNTISKDTDYLIVGQQDFRVVGDDGMSNKQEKAQKLLVQGVYIEVLSESDFLKHL
jgi:DNA polymerase-3 subunit epsilon